MSCGPGRSTTITAVLIRTCCSFGPGPDLLQRGYPQQSHRAAANPGAGEDSLGKRKHHHDDGKLYGSPASAGRVSEKYPENRDRKHAWDLEELKKTLVSLGYERMGQVEGEGQFAIRGGILDIFPLTEETPVRVELWGDEVDSIRSFDVESQRSIENLEELVIYPATEVPADSKTYRGRPKAYGSRCEGGEKSHGKAGEYRRCSPARNAFSETKEKLTEFQGQGSLGLDGIVDYFYTVGNIGAFAVSASVNPCTRVFQ